MIYDAAAIIPTIIRSELLRAVRSVFEQDYQGSIQIMLGIDHAEGHHEIVEELKAECPENRTMTVLELGYSTSSFRGGYYRNWSGGAIRTLLSYAANSRYLAYLDDDNWWGPNHISSLRQAIDGVDWAFSYRWYVDPNTQRPLFVDEWESVGPDKGIYAQKGNGFVDTNCLMIDKDKCHWDLPAWCVASHANGSGVDRVVFERLRNQHSYRASGKATTFYVFRAGNANWILKYGEQRTDKTPPPTRQPSMSSGIGPRQVPKTESQPTDITERLKRLEGAVKTLAQDFKNHEERVLPNMLAQSSQQSESLDSLNNTLEVERGWLPATRGWACSPDFLLILAKHILSRKPARIVECGAGVSSVVVARCLEMIGAGHLYSLEHLETSATEAQETLEERGLNDYVSILVAPLKPSQFHDLGFQWYDIADLPEGDIDCLIVDGPPMDTSQFARYPVAPMLFDRLSPDGTVFLDDYLRESERRTVITWRQEFPDWGFSVRNTEKGCAILKKPESGSNEKAAE